MHTPKAYKTGTFLTLCTLLILLSSCGHFHKQIKDGPPSYPVDVSKIPDAKPTYLPLSPYGNPESYVVNDKRYYVLKSAKGYHAKGIASWYGTKFNGYLTSSREPYNLLAMTGASRVLPIPSFARVTNLENNRSIVIKINDRGPFSENRIIDLSYAAAKKLGFVNKGTTLVAVTAIVVDDQSDYATHKHNPSPSIYLQVGAFHHLNNALDLQQKIIAITSRPVFIQHGISNRKPIYRVEIGPLIGVGAGDRLNEVLKKHGFGNAIKKIS